MRFNLEISAGDMRLADVSFFGRQANVSIWMGIPTQAVESQYRIQFNDAWADKGELEKGHDAIRVAVADTLANGFDPALITLVVEEESPRWPGRIFRLEGSQ